jgi:hypothetical protein
MPLAPDASVPNPSILATGSLVATPDCRTKVKSGPENVDEGDESDDSDDSDEESAFEEHGCLSTNKRQHKLNGFQMYYEDSTWIGTYNKYLTSFLNLYIFADKYSVHQLRDDIMTAIFVQCFTWNWFPDPNQQWLAAAYAALPPSAKIVRLMILTAALYWLPDGGKDLATRIQTLHEWQPAFASELSLAQAKMLQAQRDGAPLSLHSYCRTSFASSCKFHEHLLLDQNACRERIREGANVFAELIKACAKDGRSMFE